jgi:uncharacterized protein YjbI with pentapeptide repeats
MTATAPTKEPSARRRRPPGQPAVLRSTSLSAWTQAWARRGKPTMTLVVKATCRLVDGEAAELLDPCAPPSGDLHHDDDPLRSLVYPSDFAIFKPRADVMLVGRAYTPGPAARASHVRFRFGEPGHGFDRRMAVVGPRRWRKAIGGSVQSEPEPFESLPLDFELAYGGPGYDANPIGAGHGRADDRLPSLEDPAQLIRSRGEHPPPICFAPIPATWPARHGGLGRYDEAWLQERWPYFPDDFDWAYFQAAPTEQQLDALQGDESFEIAGARPDGVVLRGRLPAIVPCAHVCRGDEATELVLRLDTVLFDTEALTVTLCWRGILDVSGARAPEIDAFYLAEERLPESTVVERVRAMTALPVSPPFEEVTILADPERAARLRREVVARLADGDSFANDDLQGADLARLDLSGACFAGANLKDACLAECDLRGADLSAAQLTRADLGGAVLTEANLEGADLTEACLEGADASRARLARCALDRTRARHCMFQGVTGDGVSFVAADLRGTAFGGASLPDADLSKARLDGCDLCGADLDGVRLYDACGVGVTATGANLRGARADDVRLTEGSFRDVVAPDSVWDGAVLDDSSWFGAKLSGASLCDSSCRRAVFSSADLRGAQLRHATLTDASLLASNAMEATFEGAQLDGADFRGANLHGAETLDASMVGARLEQAVVTGSKLQ